MRPDSPSAAHDQASCRFCGAPLDLTVVDLGMSPLCESFVSAEQIRHMEPFFPLHVFACERCYLVQLEAFVPPDEIFTEYAYFSAYSTAFVEHARQYVEMIIKRLRLGSDDLVVELASNDGYLLQHFVGTDIPILGIDPAANVAKAAEQRGVPTLVDFFGRTTAERLVEDGKRASLIVGNNVLAQVPDLNDFLAGVKVLLRDKRDGDVRVPAPAPPLRRASVRHDLPRAFLVLLARDDRGHTRARTVSPLMTSRKCGRTAARCGSTRSTQRARMRRRRRARHARP